MHIKSGEGVKYDIYGVDFNSEFRSFSGLPIKLRTHDTILSLNSLTSHPHTRHPHSPIIRGDKNEFE